MITIQTADAIVSAGAFLMAYVFSVTIVGALYARILARLGDTTAQSLGFTAFNPLLHVDPFGLLFLYFMGLGWGRQVPYNPTAISPQWHTVKVILAFLAESMINITLSIIGIVGLVMTFGKEIFRVLVPMIADGNVLSYRNLTSAYPTLSSFDIVLMFIVISGIYITTMLATLSLLINSFRYMVMTIMRYYGGRWRYGDFVLLLVPLALVVIFAYPLRMLIIRFICIVGFILGCHCFPF